MAIFRNCHRFVCLSPLIVLAVLLFAIPASAEIVRSLSSPLYGTGDVLQLTVNAQVDRALSGGSYLYTYSYTVTYDIGTADVHIYGVENPNDSSYFNAQNSGTSGTNFIDPSYVAGSYANIEWNSGSLLMPTPTTTYSRVFSYQSRFAPQDIKVYAYAVDGGTSADGWTLGMGDMIPEPGGIIALAFGMLGLAPKFLKRR